MNNISAPAFGRYSGAEMPIACWRNAVPAIEQDSHIQLHRGFDTAQTKSESEMLPIKVVDVR